MFWQHSDRHLSAWCEIKKNTPLLDLNEAGPAWQRGRQYEKKNHYIQEFCVEKVEPGSNFDDIQQGAVFGQSNKSKWTSLLDYFITVYQALANCDTG